MTTAAGHAGPTTHWIRRFLPPAATAMFAACVLFRLLATAALAAPDIPVICEAAAQPAARYFSEERGIDAPASGYFHHEVIDHACLPADIREAFRRMESQEYARIYPNGQAQVFPPSAMAFSPRGEARPAYPVFIANTHPSRAPPVPHAYSIFRNTVKSNT